MAKITTGYTFGLNARQAMACRLMAEGKDEKDVLAVIFGIGPESTDHDKRSAAIQLHKWMRKPEYAECYRAIVREIAFPAYGAAQQRLCQQIYSNNDWLANKAANDVLTRFGPYVMGEEDKQIKVVVEGMPALGTPDADD